MNWNFKEREEKFKIVTYQEKKKWNMIGKKRNIYNKRNRKIIGEKKDGNQIWEDVKKIFIYS